MDSGNTNNMDNNLNNETINPSVNNTNEDLTNIFDTPIDESSINLGVGETSLGYTNQDTEILDLNGVSEFKEAEIKVEPLEFNNAVEPEVNSVNVSVESNVVENNPFELNNNSTENVVAPITNNLGVADNNTLMNEVSQEPIVVDNNENVNLNSEQNVMDNLNPVELDSINNDNLTQENIMNTQPNILSKSMIDESNVNSEVSVAQEPSVVPPMMNTNEELPSSKKKKSFLIPLIIVLGVVGILAALVAVYFFIFTSPKNIFNKAVKDGVVYLNNAIENTGKYNTITGNGSLSYEISANDADMQSVLDMFNGIAVNYNYGIDYENKLFNVDFNSTFKNETLLNFSLYGENSKAYILFTNIYNKYISTDVEGYESLFNTDMNQEEVKIILNSFEKALSESLVNDDFVKSEETMKIDGENVKVTKNSLVLNNKNVSRISKSILTILKDDADFISAVNKISTDDSIDTKANLEDAIENIGEVDESDDTVMAFSIYTKGLLKECVGFSIEVKDDETTKISISKSEQNIYLFTMNQGSEEVLTGTIKANVTNSTNKANSDIEVALSIPDFGSIKVNVISNANYNAGFNKADISNNIDINQVTDFDKNAIMNAIMRNPGFANLMVNIQQMSTLTNSDNSSYNDYSDDSYDNYGYEDEYDYYSYDNSGI